MKRNLFYLCVLFLVLVGSAPFSFGQDLEAKSLQGIQVIEVLVEGLSSEGRRTGLTAEQIKTDVELQLRKVGIRIDESASSETLYVNLTVVEIQDPDEFIYHVDLQVLQKATLMRDSSINTLAVTWDKAMLGIIAKRRARDTIRGALHDKVDQFLNDYLTVNPVTR